MNKTKIAIFCVLGAIVVLILSLSSRKYVNVDLMSRAKPGSTVQDGISPDGKWILKVISRGDNFPRVPVVQPLKGSRLIKWPGRYFGADDGWWLPDSRHWASLEVTNEGRTLMVFSLDNAHIRRIPLTLMPETTNLIGFTPQGHALFTNGRPDVHSYKDSGTLAVADVDISTTPAQIRMFSLKKPAQAGGEWGQVILSPKGDRVAWVYFYSQSLSLDTLISYCTRRLYTGGPETLDLWVSRLDDSPPRFIGRLKGRQVSFAPEVRWTADGKCLSVTINGQLYSVPLD